MTIKEIDDSRFLIPVNSAEIESLFTAKFPEFREYKGRIGAEKVAKYICLLCDSRSPLISEQPDYFKRKYVAANLSGFPTEKGKKTFTGDAEKIIVGENEVVNRVMVAYISSYGKPEYTLLISFMALFSFETQKALTGKGAKETPKVLDFLLDRIQSLEKSFFSSGQIDEYSKIRQALYEKIEKEQVRLRPEMVIRDLTESGELPSDFNPYGEYKVNLKNDMIFLGDRAPKE